MADDDHRDRLARQVVLEPLGGLDVEVVRRLVEEHQVGALEQAAWRASAATAGRRRRSGPVRKWSAGEAAGRSRISSIRCSIGVGVLVLDLVLERRRSDEWRARGRRRRSASAISLAASSSSLWRSSREARPDRATSIRVWSGPKSGCWTSRLTRMPGADSIAAVVGGIVAGQERQQRGSCPRRSGPTRPIRSPARTSNASSWKMGSPGY